MFELIFYEVKYFHKKPVDTIFECKTLYNNYDNTFLKSSKSCVQMFSITLPNSVCQQTAICSFKILGAVVHFNLKKELK